MARSRPAPSTAAVTTTCRDTQHSRRLDAVHNFRPLELRVLRDPAHVASPPAAITTLHRHGLVFGNLRKPTLQLVGDRVVLVDFDWCGRGGDATYPGDILLLESLKRYRKVERG